MIEGRRAYIDWARGIAVLLMIDAHITDAWTRPASKSGVAFGYSVLLGGFAAPAFLWLAGVSLALAASRLTLGSRRGVAVETICRRGLEIFVLAFLFRLQSFIVSPGAHLVSVFRVDILNIMGPAIAIAGLLWGIGTDAGVRVITYGIAATAIAMVTPVVRASAAVEILPTWVQWYVRPSAGYTTFTVFPWAGFVFAGAACGVLMALVRDRDEEDRFQAISGLSGVLLVMVGWYMSTRPSIYEQSSFWTTSPTWFAIRVGVLMTGLSALYLFSRLAGGYGVTWRPLARFGQQSLFVYWIHVELVYGYAASAIRGRLSFWDTLPAFLLFSLLMYGAVVLRDFVMGAWRTRRRLRIFSFYSPNV